MIEVDVFTDASGNIKSKDFGYSSVFWYDEVEYYSSYRITQDQLKNILGCEVEFSNPTIEVLAFSHFLMEFAIQLRNSDLKDQLPIKLKIHSDYKGVSCWFNNEWAMSKKYIIKLIRLAKKYRKELKNYGVQVEVVWIKGHNGNKGNERADELAGQRLDKSNLEEFFTTLNKELC